MVAIYCTSQWHVVLLAPLVHRTPCHGAPSSAPCPEPGVRATNIFPVAGMQEGAGSTMALLAEGELGQASPWCCHTPCPWCWACSTAQAGRGLSFWERSVLSGALGTAPACACLWEDKLVMSQSKLSSRINLVTAHMGAPQRAVMEGRDLLRSERVGKLIHKGWQEKFFPRVGDLRLNFESLSGCFSHMVWGLLIFFFFLFIFFPKMQDSLNVRLL